MKKIKLDKPCKKLGYCPYGHLIEQFPLKNKRDKDTCQFDRNDYHKLIKKVVKEDGDIETED